MKHPMALFISTALIVTTLSYSDSFAASSQDVVVDRQGNTVRALLSGGCARTKWVQSNDECGNQPAPAPRQATSGNDQRSYNVFFDFNASTLSDFAKKVITNLVKRTDDEDAVYELVGHADRSGSRAYNLKISQKRALAVKDALRELGVSNRNIQMGWKGESTPLVPTSDGIREPQNRRTEIRVTK